MCVHFVRLYVYFVNILMYCGKNVSQLCLNIFSLWFGQLFFQIQNYIFI